MRRDRLIVPSPGEAYPRRHGWLIARLMRSAFFLSLVLHVGAIGVFFMLEAPQLPTPFEEAIEVHIVSSDRPALASSDKPRGDQQTAAEMTERTEGFVQALQMKSADILADPRSQEAGLELNKLAADDQIDQLCGLEAMAQVALWNSSFQPERVKSYSRSYPEIRDNVLIADGAVLQSKRNWYELRFKCTVDRTRLAVRHFEFQFGKLIPKAEWPRYNLHDEIEEH